MSLLNVVPVTVEDYRRRARLRLPGFLFDYADGGANREETLAANSNDFLKIKLRQQVMRDVSGASAATTLLGQNANMPLALAPVGLAGMYARRGEVQAARAAQAHGVPFSVSTNSICSMSEVNEAVATPAWFQLYMLRDRGYVQEILQNAWDAGTRTLIFTIDLPIPGLRLRDYQNGMLGTGLQSKVSKLLQLASSPVWAYDVGIKGKPHLLGNLAGRVPDAKDLNSYKSFVESQFDPAATWEDIRWLRDQWRSQLLIKGVLEVDDALAAVDCGAEGVVVSNHGGRQLDGVASTISKLPGIAQAVDDRAEVFLDGGVRNGIDVVRAVALGARGVLIGRPWLFALAAQGEQGVSALLQVFANEIAVALTLAGVKSVHELTPEMVENTLSIA
ncbi:L-lactate dehydrogenase [Congregibacter variabilis]|uniref:L-lactate dehydrogenase n=1 Tax=Congregibacter variabilis TaxID=3081200 RepID=A0ABZ0I6K5_9GAMM|nr:L-lactate dehydrogenase [Congregibacter sp. IMCC43200]